MIALACIVGLYIVVMSLYCLWIGKSETEHGFHRKKLLFMAAILVGLLLGVVLGPDRLRAGGVLGVVLGAVAITVQWAKLLRCSQAEREEAAGKSGSSLHNKLNR